MVAACSVGRSSAGLLPSVTTGGASQRGRDSQVSVYPRCLSPIPLWGATMTGDVKAAVAVVKIMNARVHLNGLESTVDGFGRAPRTFVVPPPA